MPPNFPTKMVKYLLILLFMQRFVRKLYFGLKCLIDFDRRRNSKQIAFANYPCRQLFVCSFQKKGRRKDAETYFPTQTNLLRPN